jgi:hypothetical protein
MRHLGTQKHARNYLEGTKHLIKDKTKKEQFQEVVQENEISEECVQEEENNEIHDFSSRFFLDSDTIRFITTMSKRIELSPFIAWIITLFHQLKNILPQNSTIELENDDISENIFVRH